jgi:hypothetical protein
MPNFVLLDTSQPDITQLLVAMLQARQAVARRSWSHPQQAGGEDWWADVLADPRARKRDRDKAIKQATYRLADEARATILVACSKCDWKAAYGRNELIASHGAGYPLPSLLNELSRPYLITLRRIDANDVGRRGGLKKSPPVWQLNKMVPWLG